ncbi:MAG: ion transporter, partial [Deltaproteobacteria bacterium]
MKSSSSPSLLTRVNDFLKRLIQHPVTDLVVILLIVASLVVLVLQLIYERKDPHLGVLLERLTRLITLLFFVELSLRFSVERNKRRFFRKYWLDILALAPYFRAFRVLRIFMLLRIFRLGKLLSRHMRQMRFLLLEGIAEHLILLLVIVALVLGCAFLIEFVEGEVN